MKKDEFRSKLEFRLLWWEMEEIEPLTPNTKPYNETNEVPIEVSVPEKEGFLNT